MNLFSLFSNNTFRPVWKFSAKNVLWRIMFSGDGFIIGEDRDTNAKSVQFFCLKGSTGIPLWQEKQFDEQWWTGLIGMHNGRLYLHGFRKPDMPEQKNITAVNIANGEIAWKNTDCTFYAIRSPHVFGYRDMFERRLYYRLDESTGAFLEELSSPPEGIEHHLQYEKTDFQFPEPVTGESGDVWKWASETKSFHNAEYAETARHHILNVYAQNAAPEEGLKNSLSIIDRAAKKKVYSDILNASTPYPVPDSFFVDGDRVYYIKDRKTLVAVDLKQ